MKTSEKHLCEMVQVKKKLNETHERKKKIIKMLKVFKTLKL